MSAKLILVNINIKICVGYKVYFFNIIPMYFFQSFNFFKSIKLLMGFNIQMNIMLITQIVSRVLSGYRIWTCSYCNYKLG